MELAPHPVYFPDPASSDSFLFTGLAENPAGSRFSSDDAVMHAVEACLEGKIPAFPHSPFMGGYELIGQHG